MATNFVGNLIPFEHFKKAGINLAQVNFRLQSLSTRCLESAYQTSYPVGGNFLNNLPFAGSNAHNENYTRALILVTPINSFTEQKLASGEIFEESLGHCYILHNKTTDVCSIMDVCLHNQYLSLGGFGSILMANIIGILGVSIPITTTLWLGVDVGNKNLYKVVNLYAKFGFKDPFLNTIDPFNNQQPFLFIVLTRPNDYVWSIKKNRTINEVNFLSTICNITNNPNNFCLPGVDDVQVYFKTEYAEWLRLLTVNSKFNSSQKTQVEIAGGMKLSLTNKEILSTDRLFWEIDKNELYPTIIGDEESVNTQEIDRFTFHTHPVNLCIKYNTNIAPPSGKDVYHFLYNALFKLIVMSSVISTEGIYIITLNTVNNLTTLKQKLESQRDNITNYYETLERRQGAELGLANVLNYLANYNNSNINIEGETFLPLVKIQFKTWTQILSKEPIRITFPIIKSQYFVNTNSLSSFHVLYNSTVKEIPFEDIDWLKPYSKPRLNLLDDAEMI